MSDPSLFPGSSPRFGLPLLFAGQAQKEAFVNEAHALTDALLHCAIEGTATAPPSAPVDGTAWLIATGATGEWSGQSGLLACRQAGNWLFVTPVDGMRVLDRSTGQYHTFVTSWHKPQVPGEPTGGTVVDSQARAAIAQLTMILRQSGILPMY
jgi:hypothetical protein